MPFISLDNLQRFHANLLNFLLGKQDKLVSGENISTINGVSLLNGGDISITAEGGTIVYDNVPTQGSSNPVTSNGIYTAIEGVKATIDHTDAIAEANAYTDAQIVEVNNRITQLHTETVLFESSTVNYNNITLSDSVANYDYIEVFGETAEGYLLYTKLFNPNGKKFILCSVPVIAGTYASGFSFVFKEYSVSGTTLTGNSGASGQTAVTQNGKHNHTSSTTTVGITKVIGYKNI